MTPIVTGPHLRLVGTPKGGLTCDNEPITIPSLPGVSQSSPRVKNYRMIDTTVAQYGEWLASCGLARRTLQQRLTFLRRILREWGTLDVSPHEVADWLSAFEGWTRRTYHAHLKSIFDWCVEEQHLSVHPLRRYRKPPTPAPKPRPLSAAELGAALLAADDRMRAWLLLGALAGLRAHEIAKFHGRDIDDRILHVAGKGGREANLPTHPQLWELAQQYPRDGYWFPSPQRGREHVHRSLVSNMIGQHFRKVGIASGGAHRLRYTYGTNLARGGIQVRVVQELLRHGSLDTTMRYIGVDADEMSSAIRTLVA